METKHTPGPWIVMRGGWTDEGFAQYELYGNRVSSNADALLIAAAPDLLKALQSMLGLLEQVSIESGICCCGDSMKNHPDPMYCGHLAVDSGEYYGRQNIADALKAIAKATGEQE